MSRYIKKNWKGEAEDYSDVAHLPNYTPDSYEKPTSPEELKKPRKKKKKKEIVFNFETYTPKQPVRTLEQLKEIIIGYFPTIWFETQACLSVFGSLALKHLNGCPSLNLIGNPAGEKTTVLSFFYSHNDSYISDDFTPKSFVSHSANVKDEDLGKIDLLPKLKNKVLITPELAPLFEAHKDKLLDNFSILTRVLDGEGLNRDTGSKGHRGYSGDYKFCWLGASTPLRSSVWRVMGKIGNRLFFLNMSEKNRTDEDYVKMFSEESYQEKVKYCRGAINSFLDNFFKRNPIRSFEWKSQDIFILQEIIKYAKLLSKLRGTLETWRSAEDKSQYEHTYPIIEEPPRAINALLNFARGNALINHRDYLKKEDLEIVRHVCLSSMSYDRYKFFQLLQKHEGRISTEVIERELACSKDTALRTMKIFEVLGIVNLKRLPIGEGHPLYFIELKEEFNSLFQHTQVTNDAIKVKSQEMIPVPVKVTEEKLKESNKSDIKPQEEN
jgi:hypothetical protein